MCKVNCVISVKPMMSVRVVPLGYFCLLIPILIAYYTLGWAKKKLDSEAERNIIIFTSYYGRFASDQTKIPPPTEYAESSPTRRQAPELSGQRVLRSRRFAAGQIRNATAGRDRPATRQPGSQGVWLLASLVLSGPGSVSRLRAGRFVAAQTWPPSRAQADARTDAVCDGAPVRRAWAFQSSTGRASSRALRCVHSRAQHRPATAASKKTALTGQPAAVSLSDRRLVAAYEELRSQVLQGWRRAPGLTLMLTRGFRCWLETSSYWLDDEVTKVPTVTA